MRKRFGMTGKELVGNFSWHEIAKETEQLYKNILENGNDNLNNYKHYFK